MKTSDHSVYLTGRALQGIGCPLVGCHDNQKWLVPRTLATCSQWLGTVQENMALAQTLGQVVKALQPHAVRQLHSLQLSGQSLLEGGSMWHLSLLLYLPTAT